MREAFFSALATWAGGSGAPADQQLAGIRLLDLYAGSGAIGLEAASRGARGVVLVDSFRPAVEIIRRNAAATSWPTGSACAPPASGAFLGVPPAAIRCDLARSSLRVGRPRVGRGALPARRWLAGRDGLVVVERARRDPAPAWPPELADRWSRHCGETELYFASRTSVR